MVLFFMLLTSPLEGKFIFECPNGKPLEQCLKSSWIQVDLVTLILIMCRQFQCKALSWALSGWWRSTWNMHHVIEEAIRGYWVLSKRLLTFSFIRPGTFSSVRLSLLVETPNADPLPSTNRDVLFNKARQHSCKKTVCKVSQTELNLASLSIF